VENVVKGLVYRIGARADLLATEGKAAPSGDFLGNDGKTKSSSSRRDSQRSKTASENPSVGDAAGAGDIGEDHIDSITRRLKGLTDEERARVDLEGLLKKAKTMSADGNGRTPGFVAFLEFRTETPGYITRSGGTCP